MGYKITDRETGKTDTANSVEIEGEFIKTDKGNIYHGRNVNVEKVDTSGCFIATAVGIDIDSLYNLKNFRDSILKEIYFGRLFIQFYEQVSPTIANFIRKRAKTKIIVKNFIVIPATKFISEYFDTRKKQ